MRILLAIFLAVFSCSSFGKEVCVKNDKGIFCGTEVLVQETDKLHSKKPVEEKRECVSFEGKKVCGVECKKNIWGADCKKDKNETCITNTKGVICGYNCVDRLSITACASKPYFKCVNYFDEVKCGTNCAVKYGELNCDEDDPNMKSMD